MFKISTINGNERMSTQQLLELINQALAAGETEFYIDGSGQHDIGGPLWHAEGKPLKFYVKNPGQRVGSMCLPGTEIIVEGPACADVGWLNAGGKIVVKGDGGDTTGHCAAAGTIYIGGRAGTRTGSLMKHDPLYDPPELWILKSCGSFSFEFMSGGIAIVCGYDCDDLDSVLGDRSCVGMVGGILYYRGRAKGLSSKDVKVSALGEQDIRYLKSNMAAFLNAIGRLELHQQLTNWQEWHKVVPLTYEERPKKVHSDIKTFRTQEWVPQGIFSDVVSDDFEVGEIVARGNYRQRVPVWENGLYAAPCEFNCPASIPTQKRYNLLRDGKIQEAYNLVLDYTPFPGSVCGSVCPNPCMDGCTRKNVDASAQIGNLGLMSVYARPKFMKVNNGKNVGIIGGGAAGLTAAWQLARLGYNVTVYEADKKMGGKMEQVIPRSRLPQQILQAEIERIEKIGVKFKTQTKVDRAIFEEIKSKNDAVLVATGSHAPKMPPWPGGERMIPGIDFLKSINRGERPQIGKNVVVIGCGNSGMDAAVGAYKMGAEQVVCIDIQKPAAFPQEIAAVEKLGGKLMWPIYTKAITAEGVITKDEQLIPADSIIVTIGETPVLDFLPEHIPVERGLLKPNDDYSIGVGIFTAGDTVKPGRLVDAIAAGRHAALAIDAYLTGKSYRAEDKVKIPAQRLTEAYFKKCHTCELPEAANDYDRCISCGTCRDCHMCYMSCPERAITRTLKSDGTFEYSSDAEKCIGCGICAGVCPCGIWTMKINA